MSLAPYPSRVRSSDLLDGTYDFDIATTAATRTTRANGAAIQNRSAANLVSAADPNCSATTGGNRTSGSSTRASTAPKASTALAHQGKRNRATIKPNPKTWEATISRNLALSERR